MFFPHLTKTACGYLQRALKDLGPAVQARLTEPAPDRSGGDEAKTAALQAKQRVLARLDMTTRDSHILVRDLVNEAVSEANLSQMWEGWTAWV